MKFSMGDVFGRTFKIIQQAIVPIIIISLISYAAPYLALTLGMQQLGINPDDPSAMTKNLPGLGISFLVFALLTFFHISVLTEISVLQSANKPINYASVLSHAAMNIFPLVIISILFSIGMVVGLVLLIIPGIIFSVIYCVIIPTYVAEKTGIFGSFARAGELTSGHRWGIFGLYVVFGILYSILSVATTLPFSLGEIQAAASGASPAQPSLVSTIILSIINALLSAFSGVFNASLYLSLRSSKEHVSLDSVARVFD